eukprot:TRINITY_DN23791_c0_g1_i2.p3 TRINITY_DN23791_c0_g1~~TRINITY_DN23791_c0_g1_i2.p3  ORF type:complete len:109 (-),score=29.37 TRINITY_DN23791_c0_g1_i2:174-500(-)
MTYRCFFFFFQAEDGIRDVERSRGLGDVYKRQTQSTWVFHKMELDFGNQLAGGESTTAFGILPDILSKLHKLCGSQTDPADVIPYFQESGENPQLNLSEFLHLSLIHI